MVRDSTRWLVVLALGLLCWSTTVAFAQPSDEDRELAGKLYDRAAAAYSKGEYQTAIQFLEQAYTLDPDPVILYNLGRSYEGAGELDKAEALLLEVQSDPRADGELTGRVATDLKRLGNLRSGLSQLGQLAVDTNPPHARVFIDGREEGTTPFAGNLEVGRHTILVQLDGYQSIEKPVDIAKSTTSSLDLILVAAGDGDGDDGASGLRIASYVALGVGAAGVIAGVVTYFPADAQLQIYDDTSKTFAERTQAQDDGRLYATLSTVSYAVGFAGLGVGAALLVWDLVSDDGSESASASLVPQGIAIDPVHGSVSLGWRF